MIKRILKWTGIVLGCLVVIVAIFYAVVYFKTEARINKEYAVKLQSLTIPDDSASYLRGRHLAENRGCLSCHGNNLANAVFRQDENSPIGILYASNLTNGKGGINYTDEDWIRSLRHGLNRQNKSVWFMPSHDVAHISNEEMAQLICYLKKQPPVDKVYPAKEIKPLGRVLTFLGEFPLLPAEKIDHNAVSPNEIKPAVSSEYGHYLATTCSGCHGQNFKGAPAHSANEPAIPDISSTGLAGKWNDDQFIHVMRTGITPEGKKLSSAMPWRDFTFTDDELKAISLYLHKLK